jgi:hypothetical protein
MADGTPLESLENGDIQNAADSARMQEIMRDIDTPSGGSAPMGTLPAMQQSSGPMRMPQPPMYNPNMQHQMQMQPQYVPVDDEEAKPKKKNIWSSILDRIRDPLIVVLLVFVLSLPALHTQLAKYASWAFAVGGQLSWLGLGSLSLLAGILFATYRGVSDLVG